MGKSMEGLCPMLISYSLHEAVTDQCDALVARLKAAGNDVETYTAKYLGHVFQAMTDFLPEARQAQLATKVWLQQHQQEESSCFRGKSMQSHLRVLRGGVRSTL